MSTPFVAVAGATGALGKLVTQAVLARGVPVKAIVRPNTAASRTKDLSDAGATITPVDLSDVNGLKTQLQGAQCVVSTLQGLRDVMHDAQGNLLDAAVQAKVPRFIPSDFSLDFTKTKTGSNRNLDLRREFHTRLDRSGISWTSILNGGFLDLLGGKESPFFNHKAHTVGYIGQPTQPLDFTTMKDTAAFTAAVATDPKPTPKFMRCASITKSTQEIADAQSRVMGVKYSPSWMGTITTTKVGIRVMRTFKLGGGEGDLMPAWQGMQYMENMMSGDGKLEPLDNGRYPEIEWITLEEFLKENKEKNLD